MSSRELVHSEHQKEKSKANGKVAVCFTEWAQFPFVATLAAWSLQRIVNHKRCRFAEWQTHHDRANKYKAGGESHEIERGANQKHKLVVGIVKLAQDDQKESMEDWCIRPGASKGISTCSWNDCVLGGCEILLTA